MTRQCISILSRSNYSPLLRIIKSAHFESDYITFFITVAEAVASSFSSWLQFSCLTHMKHSEGDSCEACMFKFFYLSLGNIHKISSNNLAVILKVELI
jgi:hypothetical protein